MDNSLNQIADQILNAIYAGIKAPANYSISKEQIKDEFCQARNRQIEELLAQGILNPEPYRQTAKKIAVVKKDFSGVDSITTGRQEYFATIPGLFYFNGLKPIHYVTAMDKQYPFKVVYGDDIFYTLKDRYTGRKPTIWVRDQELWLLNPPIAVINWIGIRAIFENPRTLNGVSGLKVTDNDPFPAPGSLIDRIRNKMVNDYIRQYRLGSLQPTLFAGDISFADKK